MARQAHGWIGNSTIKCKGFSDSIWRGKARHAATTILSALCIAICPAVEMAYVTNGDSNTVSEIRLANDVVTRTFQVGVAPVGIAADGPRARIYVANSGSQSVTRIDLLSGQRTTLTLPGSEPEAVAVTPDGSLVLVSSLERRNFGVGSRGVIYAIDGASFSLTAEALVDDDPEDIEIAADGTRAWIACDLKIQELDLRPATFLVVDDVIGSLDGLDDFESVAATSDRSILYAANEARNRIEVVDLATDMILTSIPVGSAPEAVVLRPGVAEAHVTNQFGDSITVFSTVTNTVLQSFALGANEPRGLAFSPDGARGYVCAAQSGGIARYLAGTRQVNGSPIGVGAFPEEIAIVDVELNTAAPHWRAYR